MAGLFHGFGQRNATIGCFGEIAGAQAVRGEFTCIETSHLRALLDDPVDRARFQSPRGNVAPTIHFAKHAALVDFGGFQPAREGFDGSSGQIDHLVLIGATGFGPAEMNGERGEGRTIVVSDRHLFDKLFYAQARNFTAPSSARGKGHHQDGPITQSGEILAGTGRQQLAEDITSDGAGTLAAWWSVNGADRKPDRRFDGR